MHVFVRDPALLLDDFNELRIEWQIVLVYEVRADGVANQQFEANSGIVVAPINLVICEEVFLVQLLKLSGLQGCRKCPGVMLD